MSGPRVFGLPHLSEDAVAAYADGVLSAAAASRAQRHCAECPECADAVRGQREAAMMLRAAPAPALPSGLLDRLSGLPMSAPLPSRRSGLPTVLGADGVAMFVAHDPHRCAEAGPATGSDQAPTHPQTRPSPRRAALPMTVLASAAAVVAAGTFGGHVSTLAAAADRQSQTGSANAAGALTGGQAPGPVRPLVGSDALLPVSRTSAGAPPVQTGGLVLAADGRVLMTLTPLRGAAQQASAATAAAHRPRAARPHVDRRVTGLAALMPGAPAATP